MGAIKSLQSEAFSSGMLRAALHESDPKEKVTTEPIKREGELGASPQKTLSRIASEAGS